MGSAVRTYINYLLCVIAVIFAAFAYSNYNKIGRLQKELEGRAQQSPTEDAPKALRRPNERRNAAKAEAAAVTGATPKEDLEPPETEELRRILSRAEHDLAVSEAFKKEHGNYAITSFYVSNKFECRLYWDNINMQISSLKNKYGKLQKIIESLDFSATSDAEMEVLKQYLALREKYDALLYDEKASPEEIMEVRKEASECQAQAARIIRAAVNHTYGDVIVKYNNMKHEIEQAVSPFSSAGIGHFYFNGKDCHIFPYNGKKYYIDITERSGDSAE